MKIHDNVGVGAPKRSGDLGGVRARSRGRGAKVQATTTGTDKISVSDEARLLSRLRREIGDVGAVRAEKVQALRDKIASGAYRPDLKAVAQSFLESILRERSG